MVTKISSILKTQSPKILSVVYINREFLIGVLILVSIGLVFGGFDRDGFQVSTPTVAGRVLAMEHKTYKQGDNPVIVLKGENRNNRLGLSNLFSRNSSKVQVVVRDVRGGVVQNFEVFLDSENEQTVTIDKFGLKPGRYIVTVTDLVTGDSLSQDFNWGVLVLNPNKSVYVPGENVNIAFGVLDDMGMMECSASLKLTIINDQFSKEPVVLSTDDNTIRMNSDCFVKDYTENPDFETDFEVHDLGIYELAFTAETNSGIYTIEDSFEVVNPEDRLFDIERKTATRIYPPRNYPVEVLVTPLNDFTGTVEESVPSNFQVFAPKDSQESFGINKSGDKDNGRDDLVWVVDWKAGQEYSLKYSYNAPDKSPDYALLGPLKLKQDLNNSTFGEDVLNTSYEEPRNWQIAVDYPRTLPHATVFTDTQDATADTDSVYQDVNNTTISDATLTSAGFKDTETVLIIADVNLDNDDDTAVSGIRLADTAGTAISNTEYIRELRSVDDKNEWIRLMTRTTKTSGEGIVLQKTVFSATATTQVYKASITIIGLGELTEGEDYEYGESTSTADIPASGSPTTFATITTPASDKDWEGDVLVMDSFMVDVAANAGTDSVVHGLRRDTDSTVNSIIKESENLADKYGGGSIRIFTNEDTSAHTYDVRLESQDAVTTDFDHAYSSIVAFPASLFEDFHWFNDDTTTDNPSISAFTEVGNLDFTPKSGGDFFVSGYITDDMQTAENDDARIRIQSSGTNIPSGFADTTEGDNAEDGLDELGLNLQTIENLDASVIDLDLDAAGDQTDQDFENVTFFAASMALADPPAQTDENKVYSQTTSSTVQIDVPNRYRAIMNTGDTEDYLTFYDRAQNDMFPDEIAEIAGFSIEDENTPYRLKYDSARKTTIVESSSSKTIVRVEGCIDTSAGGACLQDVDGDNDENILVTETYTFTPEGVFLELKANMYDGLQIDATGTSDIYYTTELDFNEFDQGGTHSETILYGDGETESSTSTQGAYESTNDVYSIAQGLGNYQDMIVGGLNLNGDKNISNSADGTNWLTIDGNDGDGISYREASTQTLIGEGIFNYFLLFKPQSDLDTEAEREAIFNQLTNPDDLTYTTGTEWDGGAPSTGMEFESTNSEYVYAVDSTSLSITGDITVEAWIKPESVTASTLFDIAGKWDSSNESYLLAQYGGEIRFYVDSASNYETTDAIGLTTGHWYHVAAVYNASAQTVTIYVNGVSAASTTTGIIPTSIGDDTGRFQIGAEDSTITAANFYDGNIDEVRVWSDQRTATEIVDSMNVQVSANSANLVSYWRLNNYLGTIAYDETTNDNDVTLINTPLWSAGVVPDQYNEAANAYPFTFASNKAEIDLDAHANASTLLNGAVSAEDATITVDSTTGFPSSGVMWIEGDKVSYTGTTATTFTGVSTSGDLAAIGHADNSVVSIFNMFDPSFSMRGWRDNTLPKSITIEGNVLDRGKEYNLSHKPITTAAWAQDLLWHSTFEDAASVTTTPDIGGAASANTCAFVEGKYGNAIECNASSENVDVPMAGNVDGSAGTVEFWYKNTSTPSSYSNFFESSEGLDKFSLERSNADTSIEFLITAGVTWTSVPNVFDGDWHHLRVTYDTVADSYYLYIDGVSQGEKTTAMSAFSTSYNLVIGDQNGDEPVNGIIDEFHIYDTVLGPDLIAKGGDTGDVNSDEYLADDTNDYTFSFAADDASNRGEYIWLGSDAQFEGLNVDLGTVGVEGSTITFNWEYWNGTAWTALTTTEQETGTSSFEADGNFNWTAPGNWFPYSVNGSTDLYYIRGHLESGSYSTSPIENTIYTDIVNFQHFGTLANEDVTYTIPGYTNANEGSAPIAVWHMDEGQGTTTYDTSISDNNELGDHNLTITGPTWVNTGSNSGTNTTYLQFDGSNDYLTQSYDTDFDFGTGDFTILGKFRHSSTISGTDTLFARATAENGVGYKAYMDSNGYICFGIDDTAGTFPEDSACTTTSYADSEWHSFAGVKNGTTSILLYVDGQEVASDVSLGSVATLDSGSPTLYLGIDADGVANPWDGFLKEFAVYSYARSAAQIKVDHLGIKIQSKLGEKTTDNLADGLVGWWKMDESSGNTCSGGVNDSCDSSGNGNDGAWEGITSPGVGKFGNAIVATTADYVSVADNNVLDITGEITLSAWVKAYTSNNNGTIISKALATGESNYMLYFVSAGDVVQFHFTGEVGSTHISSTALVDNTWNLVTATYDGSEVRIYINGVLDYQGSETATMVANTGELRFGTNFSTGDDWDGPIDDVRIYNRALSQTEVRQLYNYAPPPVVEYSFDENTGTTTVYDHSENGNNGTMNGTMTESDWVPGKLGSALDFDGSDDSVSIATASDADVDFAASEQFSGGAWVYITTMPGASNQDAIITKYDETSTLRGYRLVVENDDADTTGNFQVEIYDESADQAITATGANDTVNENTWYYVSFTFNGGTAGTAGDLKLYTDGVLTDSNSVNASFLGLEDVAVDFAVGDYDATDVVANNTAFTGFVDEVRIYNYIRTSAKIIEDMNGGHPVGGSPIGSQVGYWKFDEGYGDTAYDSSPQGNNGDIGGSGEDCSDGGTPCPSWSNSGKYNKALDFDNADDNVVIPDDDVYSFGNGSDDQPFSISAWVNLVPAENAGVFVSKYNSLTSAHEYNFSLLDGSLELRLFDETAGGTTIYQAGSTADISDGTWYHVVGTYDGSNTVDGIKLYVNGVAEGLTPGSTGTYYNMDNTTADVMIGARVTGTGDIVSEIDGLMDEVKIYSTALTPEQVKVEYNRGKVAVFGSTGVESSTGVGDMNSAAQSFCPPGSPATCTAPVAYWNFDENTGTSTVYDKSGNGYDLSLTNSVSSDWEIGKYGSAMDFAGTSHYGTVSSATKTDQNSSYTTSVWFQPNSTIDSGTTGTDILFEKKGTTWYQGAFRMYTDGETMVCQFYDGSTYPEALSTTAIWNAGEWHQASCVFDDTNDTYSIYIDGNLETQTTLVTGNPSQYTGDIEVGGSTNSSTESFDGAIDEVKYYDYARTPAQVAWDYNRGAPIGWWKLDECSGTTAYDSSTNSNGNNNGNTGTITIGTSGSNTSAGTCSSGASYEAWANGSNGKRGASLDFDGTDDYVDMNDVDDFDFGDNEDFSVSAWVNRNTFNTIDVIVAKDVQIAAGNSSPGYGFYIGPGDDVVLYLSDGSNGVFATTNNLVEITSSGWYHVVGTFDGSTPTAKIYINGIYVASGTGANVGETNSDDFRIGSESDGEQPFDGQIDEVKLWNYELTAEQVKTEFNSGAVRFE